MTMDRFVEMIIRVSGQKVSDTYKVFSEVLPFGTTSKAILNMVLNEGVAYKLHEVWFEDDVPNHEYLLEKGLLHEICGGDFFLEILENPSLENKISLELWETIRLAKELQEIDRNGSSDEMMAEVLNDEYELSDCINCIVEILGRWVEDSNGDKEIIEMLERACNLQNKITREERELAVC